MSHADSSSRTDANNEPWLWTVVGLLATYLLIKPTMLVMLGLARPFKGWISRSLLLRAHSYKWYQWRALFNVVRVIAGLVFFGAALHTLRIGHIADAREQLLFAIQQCLVCGTCSAVFAILSWLKDYAHDPDTQRQLAGERAERWVAEMVDGYRDQSAEARSLHGALFVFHPGTAQEFSVEVDHLLVTRRHVFVVETKYRSGTLHAAADAPSWTVTTPTGTTSMRNALKQAKNAARVLQQQLTLPCEIVPLVAVVGQDVRVVGGPTNVVVAEDLPGTLHAFEFLQDIRIANPEHILVQLRKHLSTDPAARQRHVARAHAARIRGEMSEIVQAASLQ